MTAKTAPRCTGTNSERAAASAANLRDLIGHLSAGPMGIAEARAAIKLSTSGARKYFHDLIAAGIVESGRESLTVPLAYCLTTDAARVATYIASLGHPVFAPNPRRSSVARVQRDASRHIHVMHDDAHFAVRIRRMPVAPDPLALDRAFFRPPVADAAPRLAMPVIPPKPQGFPVPGDYRFMVPA